MLEKIIKVLAVEDSADDCELVLNELSQAGFMVVHKRVETSAALRDALKNETWDVVICDHNLPALDSESALKIVQEMADDIPFIVVSGHISEALAIRAMQLGARDFVRKDNLSRLGLAVEREVKQAVMQSELKAIKSTLHNVSYFDGLTGLPNRAHLFNYLEVKMSEKANVLPFAIFLIDINRFRLVTKSLGMLVGNKVLIETAKRLRSTLDEYDFVARIGADTFAVVANLKQESGAREIADMIDRALSVAFQIDMHELFIKVSMGASFYPRDGLKCEELYKNAESALYSAKADGGSYKVYNPERDTRGKERLSMETALYHALKEGQFVLHYQPQFDLASGRMIGAEALIRWQHPETGMISPGEFIPILEETGLIVPAGEWVMRTACAQNKQWQDAGLPPVVIAVNLSVIQFRQPGLAQTVRNILQETGLAPQYLELEITENIAMHAEEGSIAILEELRDIGIQIAIDDFGTGYSSLSYLKRFPIDKLKIDQSFVRDLQNGPSDIGIVLAIIGMGHSLKLKVIAEGVETQEQSDILKLNGCDEVQGYFYGKPMDTVRLGLSMAQ